MVAFRCSFRSNPEFRLLIIPLLDWRLATRTRGEWILPKNTKLEIDSRVNLLVEELTSGWFKTKRKSTFACCFAHWIFSSLSTCGCMFFFFFSIFKTTHLLVLIFFLVFVYIYIYIFRKNFKWKSFITYFHFKIIMLNSKWRIYLYWFLHQIK